MDRLLLELRYAFRSLLKNRGLFFVVILTLSLGIGATTAIFCMLYAVLLRPLPYKDPQKLVALYEKISDKGIQQMHASGPNFTDWRNQSDSFESMASYSDAFFNVSGTDYPERVPGVHVSQDFFSTLGVQPLKGRVFHSNEIRAGEKVAVLSYSLWQRRFHGSNEVLSKPVRIDGTPAMIVGIMPPAFIFPAEAEVWMPHPTPPDQLNRSLNMFSVIARLKGGLTQAQTELDTIASRLALQFPESNRGHQIQVLSLHQVIAGTSKTPLLVLFFAVGFLLLICCANVGSLMLAHAQARQKELAVRVALGESRVQMIRQLLYEGLILSIAGCAAGLLFAFLAVRALPVIYPGAIPRLQEITIDFRMILFSFSISFGTALCFSWFPVSHIFKMDLQKILHSPASGVVNGKAKLSRSLLVVAEVALACALTAGAALLMMSFVRLVRIDTGFRSDHLLTLRLELPSPQYSQDHQKTAFYETLLQQIRGLKSVESAGAVNLLPMTGVFMQGLTVQGVPSLDPAERPITAFRVATPEYFEALGIPVLEGREFGERDSNNAQSVALVDRTTARRWWPDETAIGKRISLNGAEGPWLTIIGIVGDVRYHGLDKGVFPTVYVPHSQSPFLGMMLAVRTSSNPSQVAGDIRRIVAGMNSDLPIYRMIPFDLLLSDSVVGKRFPVIVIVLFSSLALFLAILGIYGVVSHSTRRRTREIGIRKAVGAKNSDILRLIINEGILLTVIGLLIGLTMSMMLVRFIASMLFSTSPLEPVAFFGVSAIVLFVGVLASYIPARRALKVDPNLVLKYE